MNSLGISGLLTETINPNANLLSNQSSFNNLFKKLNSINNTNNTVSPHSPKALMNPIINSGNNIKYVRFKVNKTIEEMRARSTTPKGDELSPKKCKFRDCEKESSKKQEQLRNEFQEAQDKIKKLFLDLKFLVKNEIYTKKGSEVCLQIIDNFSRMKFDIEDESLIFNNLKNYLEKIMFVNDQNTLKKLEKNLDKNMVFFQGCLWKDMVHELYHYLDEEKKNNRQNIKSLENEKNELAILLECQKNENLKIKEEFDLLLLVQMESSQKEVISSRERMNNIELYLQKLSNEKSKIREETQLDRYQLLQEKEELEKKNEKNIAELCEKIDKLKKDSTNKDMEISNLRIVEEYAKDDLKKMIIPMKNAIEKIAKYEERIFALMNENKSLKVKAAVALDELTPRPSFQKFKEIFELSDNYFLKKTTKELTEDLSKISKNYLIAEVNGILSPKSKTKINIEQKLEGGFSSYLSMNTLSESFNSLSNNYIDQLQNQDKDEIQEKMPNSNLKGIIPKRTVNWKKEPISAVNFSLSPLKDRNKGKPFVCQLRGKVLKKSKSP